MAEVVLIRHPSYAKLFFVTSWKTKGTETFWTSGTTAPPESIGGAVLEASPMVPPADIAYPRSFPQTILLLQLIQLLSTSAEH